MSKKRAGNRGRSAGRGRVVPFSDGITNITNTLANKRAATTNNVITSNRLDDSQLRAIYKTGLGAKIISIKAGYALNETLQFKSDKDKELYCRHLQRAVKKAAKFMIGFGRGIILMNERGADLEKAAVDVDLTRVRLQAFSGDMVTAQSMSFDLNDDRYQKPMFYSVRGKLFHYTRVIDFTYYLPPEMDLPTYKYGGISEFEMIHTQLINDAVVERASGTILDKNSTLVHKVKGFANSVRCGEDQYLIDYYAALAQMRGIFGDAVIDSEDDMVEVAQSLSNLDQVDNITIRRLALVTSIPVPMLVGESVQGLNSTGSQERQSFQDMVESLQFDYLIDPIEQLCLAYGIEGVIFKENQGGTANERLDFETKVIDNAVKLSALGEDHRAYLIEHDVIKNDPWADLFEPPVDDGLPDDEPLDLAGLLGDQP